VSEWETSENGKRKLPLWELSTKQEGKRKQKWERGEKTGKKATIKAVRTCRKKQQEIFQKKAATRKK